MNIEPPEILINLIKYPIDRPESDAYKAMVNAFSKQLATQRLLNMEGFLTEAGTQVIANEIDSLLPSAVHVKHRSTAYGESKSENLPDDHPHNIKNQTDRYGLARHQLGNTQLDSIYTWEPVRNFVRDLLGLPQIFLHEDPSNALVVQIYKQSGGIAWHFDRALFSTILNIRESDDGGVFECAPNVRSETDPCFDEVRDVLLGQSDRVERNKVKAGSFTIMYGRYTLHRVTENRSAIARYSAVLSYEDRPGVKLDTTTRKRFFGDGAPSD